MGQKHEKLDLNVVKNISFYFVLKHYGPISLKSYKYYFKNLILNFNNFLNNFNF